MIALAWVSRPALKAPAISSKLSTNAALIAIAQGIAAALVCGPRAAIVILGASYLAIRLAQWIAYRRDGGITDASLAWTEQALEVFVLAIFASRAV